VTELLVFSGKGGTGKTSVTASLAALARNGVLADCDVDAANLHLVLAPTVERAEPFVAGHAARIRSADCSACGDCWSLCRFAAIKRDVDLQGRLAFCVDPIACEGCGVCVQFCPELAIDFPERRCGQWFMSRTRFGPLVHASLDIGAENSGKLVARVREHARAVAQQEGRELILLDGPPGIGCPASAALTGVGLALLVTEPSLSGLHDMGRALDLAAHFAVPVVVCINQHDLAPRRAADITEHCRARGIPVVGCIPHDPRMTAAQIAGLTLVEHAPDSEAARAIIALWQQIEHRLAALTLDEE